MTTRWIARCLVAAALLGPSVGVAGDAELRGDAAWARRGAGFLEVGRVDPAPVREAIEAWGAALGERPGDAELRGELMDALYFAIAFTEVDEDEARSLADRLLALAEEGVALVDSAAGLEPGRPEVATPAVVDALRPIPGAAAAHFWAAAAWGVWGMSHGNLAAARRDAAGRVRDHAELAARLDETYADGGGWRLLGRLHSVTPRVPFVTGWIDRRAGVRYLEAALEVSRRDARNPLFLAEALLASDESRRCEAVGLLREVAARQPSQQAVVEESALIAEAREVLDEADAERCVEGVGR